MPRFATTDDEAAARAERFRSWDPYPEIMPALLNSADLEDYIAATAMLFPWGDGGEYASRLKPATCSLMLEPIYHSFVDVDGDRPRLVKHSAVEDGGFIFLPANSIVFVTVAEFFRLPDYIAARFNFRIKHVYQGLLLGTGPIIDPGYHGQLHFPIHNLTTHSWRLRCDEAVIHVEFTKLSPLPSNARAGSPRQRSDASRQGTFRPFPSAAASRRSLGEYVGQATNGEPVQSSIGGAMSRFEQRAAKAEDEARKANRRASRFQNLQIAALIAAGIAFLGIIGAQIGIAYQTYSMFAELEQLRQELTGVTDGSR